KRTNSSKVSLAGSRFAGWLIGGLGTLRAAQLFQGLDDLCRPVRHLIIAQRALDRVELGPQQDGVFPCRHRPASENLDRAEVLHVGNVEAPRRTLNLRERDALRKQEGEITVHGGELRERLIARRAQGKREQPVNVNLSDVNFLLQFARSRDIGMQLTELRDGIAVSESTGRASGMKVRGRVCIEGGVGQLKAAEQRFNVALQIKK